MRRCIDKFILGSKIEKNMKCLQGHKEIYDVYLSFIFILYVFPILLFKWNVLNLQSS